MLMSKRRSTGALRFQHRRCGRVRVSSADSNSGGHGALRFDDGLTEVDNDSLEAPGKDCCRERRFGFRLCRWITSNGPWITTDARASRPLLRSDKIDAENIAGMLAVIGGNMQRQSRARLL
jgi:hypothetical protein